jgi:hypothetical protein
MRANKYITSEKSKSRPHQQTDRYIRHVLIDAAPLAVINFGENGHTYLPPVNVSTCDFAVWMGITNV